MMSLLSLFTGNWKKSGRAEPAPASARRTGRTPRPCHRPPTSLEERQRLLAHHVRLVARGMANGLCVYGSRGGLGKTKVVLETLKEEGVVPVTLTGTLHAAGDVHVALRASRVRRLPRRLRRHVPQPAAPSASCEVPCGKARRASGW